MSCYNPLHYYNYGVDKKTYKKSIVILKNKYYKKNSMLIEKNSGILACGKCMSCRLAYSREWANRCVLEAQTWKSNYFVTLTYNNENLPLPTKLLKNNKTGEVTNSRSPLNPKHLTKFLKDLRAYWDTHYKHQNIRFFACGEYGERYGRPHFHVLLFNLPIHDLEFSNENYQGDKYYTSKIIEKIWAKGFVSIGDVNWSSAAYTARYIMKKQTGKTGKDFYEKQGLIPEFTRMSRRPGIGAYYFEENYKKIYANDTISIPTPKGVIVSTPPKFYDNMYYKIDPKNLYKIKCKREKTMAKRDANLKRLYPDLTPQVALYNEFTNNAKKALYLKNMRNKL